MIRFKDTCAEAKEFLTERNLKRNLVIACDKLLKVNTEVGPAKVKGDRSKSVLFDACILAKSLQEKGKEKKWKIIREVWVEMLAYAATHCRGNHPTCSIKDALVQLKGTFFATVTSLCWDCAGDVPGLRPQMTFYTFQCASAFELRPQVSTCVASAIACHPTTRTSVPFLEGSHPFVMCVVYALELRLKCVCIWRKLIPSNFGLTFHL
ncbi:hypothetical protein FXO38_31506 [Capsicum annuum]|nr:hypothetical protein FXO38_31506 [Capsicum annuum]